VNQHFVLYIHGHA
jgi:hypothetical protein